MNQSIARPFALSVGALALVTAASFGQTFDCTVSPSSTLSGSFSGEATFAGTLIGNYDQTTNPTGTRTLNFSIFGTRPPAPTNIAKTLSGTGEASGSANTVPTGTFRIGVSGSTSTVENLSLDLIGASANPSTAITLTVTYQSFLTAAPNNSYPFIVPITLPLGSAEVDAITIVQTGAASGTAVPSGPDQVTYAISVPADVTTTIIFQGAPSTSTQNQLVAIAGTLNLVTGASTASISIDEQQTITEEVPLPPNTPFDLPPLSGTGEAAHLLLNMSLTEQSTGVIVNASLNASGVPAGCPSDWDGDGDVDSDDVIAFFTDFEAGEADLDGDSDTDSDDIIGFFAGFEAGC